jgi:hypothetical protein
MTPHRRHAALHGRPDDDALLRTLRVWVEANEREIGQRNGRQTG